RRGTAALARLGLHQSKRGAGGGRLACRSSPRKRGPISSAQQKESQLRGYGFRLSLRSAGTTKPKIRDQTMIAPKVLISDALSPAAVQIFKDRGIEVDFQPSLGKDKDKLAEIIGNYD